MYRVKCKRKTDTLNLQHAVSKNNKMLRGICSVCRSRKSQFVATTQVATTPVATTGGDLVNSINSVSNKVKLPWAKFPGEMHLPGMNIAGPGTNLDERLLLLMLIKNGVNL